jgi:Sec-independent protein translocase protein TatA
MKQSTLTITFLVLAFTLWIMVFIGYKKVRELGRDVGKSGGHILQSTR